MRRHVLAYEIHMGPSCSWSLHAQAAVELIKRGKPDRLHNSGMAIVTLAQTADIFQCISKLQQVVQDGRPLAVSTQKFL